MFCKIKIPIFFGHFGAFDLMEYTYTLYIETAKSVVVFFVSSFM